MVLKNYDFKRNEAGDQEGGGADDPLKNIKSEFDRKLGNQEEQLKDLSMKQQQLLDAIQGLNNNSNYQPPAASQQLDAEDDDLMYTNPAKYKEKIKDEIAKEIKQEINQNEAVRDENARVIAELAAEYPELNYANHDLHKKTLEIYNKMPERERTSPLAYKLAVNEAAGEVGVKPMSRRSAEEKDNFSLPGSSYTNQGVRKTNTQKKIPEAMLVVAEKMGYDADDPKFQEKLKKHLGKEMGRWHAKESKRGREF